MIFDEYTKRVFKRIISSIVATKIKHEVQRQIRVMSAKTPFHYAYQPNYRFNADANTGHAFGIFMASIGALRTSCYGAG